MSQQKHRILSINAHPHDFTHSAGTLGIHVEKGDHVTVVSVTSGAFTHNEELRDELLKNKDKRDTSIVNVNIDKISKSKTQELEKACNIFGITDVRMLGYPQPFRVQDFTQSIDSISEIITEIKPTILIMQSPFDRDIRGYTSIGLFANDHAQTALATIEAQTLASSGRTGNPPHSIATTLYPGVYFQRNEYDFIVDVSNWFEKRIQAEDQYISQGHTPEWSKRRMLVGLGEVGWYSGNLYGEAFVRSKAETVSSIPVSDLTMERANEPFEKQRDRIVGTKGRDF